MGWADETVRRSIAIREEHVARIIELEAEIERLRRRLNEYENLYGPPWWTDDEDNA